MAPKAKTEAATAETKTATFESIATDLLKALVENGNREGPVFGMVLGALHRVRELDGTNPPAPVPTKAAE